MAARFDVVTLGETMMRMTPPAPLRLGQSESLSISFGGAESSVAANLARLGRRTSWFSRLPDNPLGHQVTRMLRGHGVNTDDVIFDPAGRLGLYYVEYGSAPRGISVWYDRKHSAASQMTPADLPDGFIADARWLHLTGITPALSVTCRETALAAMQQAHAAGRRVSFDVNYRGLLWSQTDAAEALTPFCTQADTVMIAQRDAIGLFGVSGTPEEVAATLQSRWGGTLIVTAGGDGAAAHDGITSAQRPAIPAQMVDRLGAGDAFTSGIIDALLDGKPLGDALEFAAALAALKLSNYGDIAFTTRAEVERVMREKTGTLRR